MTYRQLVYFHGVPGSAFELSLVAGFPSSNTNLFAPDRICDAPHLDFSAYCDYLATRIAKVFPAGPIGLVGFSLGAHMAVEMGIRLRERVEEIHLIAPGTPLTSGVDLADMVGGPVFRLARDAPRFFGWLTAIQSLLAWLAPALLARILFASAQGEDAALSRNPEFMRCIAAILKSNFRGNSAGYVREVRAYVEPWESVIEQLTPPVTLWHGDADNWAPIAMSDWLAAHLNNMESMHRLPGKSHYSTLIAALSTIG
jgi:pimeloyl-ACP methyl ester carboxylesterase